MSIYMLYRDMKINQCLERVYDTGLKSLKIKEISYKFYVF